MAAYSARSKYLGLFKHVARLSATYLLLTVSTSSSTYAGTSAAEISDLSKVYVGVFGGGGAVSKTDLGQYGSAFYPEIRGGTLAVNALGETSNKSTWLVGGYIGYQWAHQFFKALSPNWSLSPAAELEGYYLGGATLVGNDIDNQTTRLERHDFQVTYPQKIGVFLINGVLHANHLAISNNWHPYLGLGIGSAVISVNNSNALQLTPYEPGINHYSSDPNAETAVFAAQPKVGVEWNISPKTHLFAEYRFLYLSDSQYTFGSAVYTTHAATSSWHVKVGSQYYNFGTIGFKYDL